MDAATAQVQYKKYDARQHALEKSMWTGSTARCVITDFLGAFHVRGKPQPDQLEGPAGPPPATIAVKKIERQHTPALMKCMDEYLVNASDHAMSCAVQSSQRKYSKVTYIQVQYLAEGVFSIVNDGPGIPIEIHEIISRQEGYPIYIPEIAFCHMFSGSNLTKDEDNTKGGTNGVGAKLGNIHAYWFLVEVVAFDPNGSRRYYRQLCKNQMLEIGKPIVIDLKDPGAAEALKAVGVETPLDKLAPFTRVTMMPDYTDFGYAIGSPEWQIDYLELVGWLRLRCCQLAAYVGPKVSIVLNGEAIQTTTPLSLARIYLHDQIEAATVGAAEPTLAVFETQIKPKVLPHKRYPWNVVAVISPIIRKFAYMTMFNGVVSVAGPHLEHLRKQFKEVVTKKLQSITKDKNLAPNLGEICKHMMLIVIGPLSGADWTGQRKDVIEINAETLKEYTFSATWCREVSEYLAAAIIEVNTGKKSKVKGPSSLTGSSKPKGYVSADNAGRRPGGPVAKLLISEGDSASTLLRDGLTLGKKNPGGPTFANYGIYCLYGVPMNAANYITRIKGTGTIVRKRQLEENDTINGLMRVLGLTWDKTYATEAERKTLRYKGVVLCVDGDVDGAGKIAGICLMNFFLFWPALIACGFVQWFMTPVIRVYPASATTTKARAAIGPIKEFYLEQEFEIWAKQNPHQTKGVRYYKGLGSHDKAEIPPMFVGFESRLYTFVLDEHAPHLYEVYFGDDEGEFKGKRKEELSSPQLELTPEIMEYLNRTRTIPCSIHLRYFAKPFKLEDTERKLLGALDAFNVVRRKCFAGARLRFGTKVGAECKTFQLAGYIADKLSYHHGVTSMEGALIGMCQDFPGARNLPLLEGIGGFGTWIQGGKDAASPRYTSITLNQELSQTLYPLADDPILPYVFVDGVRAEPKSFIPIICATAIENHNLPSEGWAYTSWSRNPSQVIEITRAFCTPEHPAHALVTICATTTPMPPDHYQMLQQYLPLTVSLRGFEPTLRMAQDVVQHFGRYELIVPPGDPEGLTGATVVIHSLPNRKWSKNLSDKLSPKDSKDKDKEKKKSGAPKYEFVEDVDDYSGDTAIHIVVKLKPGALGAIKLKYGKKGLDPLEDFLELHTRFTSNINAIRPAPSGYGGVLHFGDDYHALVLYHLPIRCRYYEKRFVRQQILLEIKVRMERETLRYITTADELEINVTKISDLAEAGEVLNRHGFPRIDHARIGKPGFATNEELRELIIEAGGPPGATEPDELPEPDSEERDDVDVDEGKERAVNTRPSYSYILNLRERDRVLTAQRKREAKLAKLESELVLVNALLAEKPFPAASVWRSELARLESVLKAQNLYT